MNRSEIRALVLEATGRSDKATLMNLAINIALKEFSAARLWSDLMVEDDISISAGTTYVDFAADTQRVAEVRFIVSGSAFQSRPLLVRPKSWIVQNFPAVSEQSSGKPLYGYIEGKKLYLVPVSDGDYTIRLTYFRLEPDMTTDDAEMVTTVGGQAVAAYATFWTFLNIEKAEDAKRWLETYQLLLRSAIKIDGDNSAVRYVAIQRGSQPVSSGDYWNDPFVRSMP